MMTKNITRTSWRGGKDIAAIAAQYGVRFA
jgi:hypothetical protein